MSRNTVYVLMVLSGLFFGSGYFAGHMDRTPPIGRYVALPRGDENAMALDTSTGRACNPWPTDENHNPNFPNCGAH